MSSGGGCHKPEAAFIYNFFCSIWKIKNFENILKSDLIREIVYEIGRSAYVDCPCSKPFCCLHRFPSWKCCKPTLLKMVDAMNIVEKNHAIYRIPWTTMR